MRQLACILLSAYLHELLLLVRDDPLCLTVEHLPLCLEHLLADPTMLRICLFVELPSTALAFIEVLLHLRLEGKHSFGDPSALSGLSSGNHLLRELRFLVLLWGSLASNPRLWSFHLGVDLI